MVNTCARWAITRVMDFVYLGISSNGVHGVVYVQKSHYWICQNHDVIRIEWFVKTICYSIQIIFRVVQFSGAMTFFLISILFALKINVDIEAIRRFFLIFPHFAVADALNTIDFIILTKSICDSECDKIRECNSTNICQLMPSCCGEVNFLF